MTEHRAELTEYRAVVGLTPRSRRPIYGLRYFARCSCGWTVDSPSYIAVRRRYRDAHATPHNREAS